MTTVDDMLIDALLSSDPHAECTCCRHTRTAELPSSIEAFEEQHRRDMSNVKPLRRRPQLPPKPVNVGYAGRGDGVVEWRRQPIAGWR